MAFLQGPVCLGFHHHQSRCCCPFHNLLFSDKRSSMSFGIEEMSRMISLSISRKSRLRVVPLSLSPSSAEEAKETPARKRVPRETLGERCMLLGTTRSLHEIAPFLKMSFPHFTDYGVLVNSYPFIQSKRQAVTTQYHEKNFLPCQYGISNKERSIVRVSTYNEPYFLLQ